MEIIAQISKGSKMDQIYLPKNRLGYPIGQTVIISPITDKLGKKQRFKPYFYDVKDLEPLKLEIIKEIFDIAESLRPENILIAGSFLEPGFKFNDIDILIIKNEKIDTKRIQERIDGLTRIKTHIISLSSETFFAGLSTDPLYRLMISKCVSKKRLTFKLKRNLDYKLLDYQLLKSEVLPDNFDFLTGNEKYYLTRNMVAILLFIQNKKLSKKFVDITIEKIFSIKIKDIRDNVLERETFSKKYKEVYSQILKVLLENLNESK